MTYTVSDIAKLVEYHLVASAPTDDVARAYLVQLVQKLELLAPHLLWRELSWVFCYRCGCSVNTDLIHPDCHHYAPDGDFLCADCWEDAS